MVNKAVRTALERLWKDRCSIFIREEVTDPVTHLTDSEESRFFRISCASCLLKH